MRLQLNFTRIEGHVYSVVCPDLLRRCCVEIYYPRRWRFSTTKGLAMA